MITRDITRTTSSIFEDVLVKKKIYQPVGVFLINGLIIKLMPRETDSEVVNEICLLLFFENV